MLEHLSLNVGGMARGDLGSLMLVGRSGGTLQSWRCYPLKWSARGKWVLKSRRAYAGQCPVPWWPCML